MPEDGWMTANVQSAPNARLVHHRRGPALRERRSACLPIRSPANPSCCCGVDGWSPRSERQTAGARPLPNTPSTASTPPQKGKGCYPCVRYDLSPMSRAAHANRRFLRGGAKSAGNGLNFNRCPFGTPRLTSVDADPHAQTLGRAAVRYTELTSARLTASG